MTEVERHSYDVVVIGAGGAGLRAVIEARERGLKVAVVSKSLFGKAHTVMAEGGCAAAMGLSLIHILLKPDLIVATDAGLDQDTYQKLAAIAPTLAQSDGDAFFEPWKDQAKAIGQAVFQSGQIAALIEGVDKAFASVADKYQQFKNKRVLLLQGRLHDDNVVAITGWRTDFLTQMGLATPDSLGELAVDQRRAFIPRDKIKTVLSDADLLIWTTESDQERAALLANHDVAEQRSRSVFTTKDLTGAIAFASPLSYPLVADQLPALIANVLH